MKGMLILLILFSLFACDLFPPEEDPPDYKNIETDYFEMVYLSFTNYYDGMTIAVKYDFVNKSSKTITSMRWDVNVTYKDLNDNVYSQIAYPDIYDNIPGYFTEYSMWVGLFYGMIWYRNHEIRKVHIWYSDSTDRVWIP